MDNNLIFSKFNKPWLKPGFYIFWVVLSLLQATFTQLLPDEAYYWTWSQHMEWGYFDHPPAIAAFIMPGYIALKSELGVRLLTVLSTTSFIYILERLINPRQLIVYYASILSIGILHFYGFMSVPDTPLLLFSATFFYLYRQYLTRPGNLLALLLSVNITLLLLSKYHGVLVVFFTVLSHLALLKTARFWLIAIVSGLLFIPHVLWQYQHGFPSIVFQLFKRAHEQYSIDLTLSYLGTLLVFFGPVVGTVLMYNALKYKPTDLFDKAMKYNLAGVIIFFTLMTFKGRVEINWIIIVLIPLLYLGYKQLAENIAYHKLLRVTLLPTLLLILIARIFMVYDFLPTKWQFENDFHGYKSWAKTVKEHAAGRPVLFMNSYQYAAEYEFYTGDPTFTLNNMMGRKDQFYIWNLENQWQGKDVFLVPNYDVYGHPRFNTARGIYQEWPINNFRSASNVAITFPEKSVKAHVGSKINVSFLINKTDNCNIDFESNKDYPAFLDYHYYDDRKIAKYSKTDFRITNNMLNNPQPNSVSIDVPEKPGKYHLYLSVKCGELPSSINSGGLEVEVE